MVGVGDTFQERAPTKRTAQKLAVSAVRGRYHSRTEFQVQVQLSIFIRDNSSEGPVKVHLDKVLKFASAAARP